MMLFKVEWYIVEDEFTKTDIFKSLVIAEKEKDAIDEIVEVYGMGANVYCYVIFKQEFSPPFIMTTNLE